MSLDKIYCLIKDVSHEAIGSLLEGGPGSGHWGHKGRPGHRGGSLPGGGKGAGIFAHVVNIKSAETTQSDLKEGRKGTKSLLKRLDEKWKEANNMVKEGTGLPGGFTADKLLHDKSADLLVDYVKKDKKAMASAERYLNDKVPEYLRKNGIKEAITRVFREWEGMSYSDTVVGLQFVARDVFKLKNAPGGGVSAEEKKGIDRYGDFYKALLKGMHQETQKELSSLGIQKLVLYRGVRYKTIPKWAVNMKVGDSIEGPMEFNSLHSWSLKEGKKGGAGSFTVGQAIEGSTAASFMVTAIIPSKNVVSLPYTGMGKKVENELVLFGDLGKVSIKRVY